VTYGTAIRLVIGGIAAMLLWTVIWLAAGAAVAATDPGGRLEALWVGPSIGMQPGAVGGVIFAVIVGLAVQPRRFDALSFRAMVAIGAVVGFVLGALPLAINPLPTGASPLATALAVLGSMTLLGALAGAGSSVFARIFRSAT
jgi:hypothetical protein